MISRSSARTGTLGSLRIVLLILGTLCAGLAFGMWLEVLHLGGNPEGGGVGLAVVATGLAVVGTVSYLLSGRVGRRGPPDD
jgi:hypothetical protein